MQFDQILFFKAEICGLWTGVARTSTLLRKTSTKLRKAAGKVFFLSIKKIKPPPLWMKLLILCVEIGPKYKYHVWKQCTSYIQLKFSPIVESFQECRSSRCWSVQGGKGDHHCEGVNIVVDITKALSSPIYFIIPILKIIIWEKEKTVIQMLSSLLTTMKTMLTFFFIIVVITIVTIVTISIKDSQDHGRTCPNPITRFDHGNFPDYVMNEIRWFEPVFEQLSNCHFSRHAGYDAPTPIQSQGWPLALTGQVNTQTDKPMSKQTSQWANEQTHKQTSKRTNKQTN